MTPFSRFVALCRALETSPRRLDKLRLVADFLRALDSGEVGTAVAYLTGRAFPSSDPRVLGVRGLPVAGPPAAEPGSHPQGETGNTESWSGRPVDGPARPAMIP